MKKNINKLSAEREAKLNAIGFAWGVCRGKLALKVDWNTRFEQLVEYKKSNGDCYVRQHRRQHVSLSRWVVNQRKTKFKNTAKISKEREAKLNSIGFDWHYNSRRVVSDEHSS